jgi:hypothetical protein
VELLTCMPNHARMTVAACQSRRERAAQQLNNGREGWKQEYDYHLEKCYDCPGLQPTKREEVAMDETVMVTCKGTCGRELEKTKQNFYVTGTGNLDTTCKKCRLEKQKETKRKARQAHPTKKKQKLTLEPKPDIPEKKPEAESHVHLSVCGREIGEISSPSESEPDVALTVDAAPESVRRCRACGCTDDDCSYCIERTGSPCYCHVADGIEVEEDLCSACAEGLGNLSGEIVQRIPPAVACSGDSMFLAGQHWAYVDRVLAVHGIEQEDREMIGFHYKSAFVHGYKHGEAAS